MILTAVCNRRYRDIAQGKRIGANKGEFMSRQNKTRVLVEKIDDAIEQAEDLGLTFVAGILMMARLEAVQTDLAANRENKQLS